MHSKLVIILSILFTSCCLEAEMASITARGEANVSVPADFFECSIGVVTQGENAGAALQRNNEKMRLILAAIDKTGISKEERRTGQFSIHPIYSQRPRDAGEDWQATILGYEVSNSLAIQTAKLSLVPQLIDAAAAAGANQMNQLRFSAKETAKARHEALAKAVENAMETAEILAKSAGVKINQVHSIQVEGSSRPGVLYAKAMESTPIEPGNVDVQASVIMQFELD